MNLKSITDWCSPHVIKHWVQYHARGLIAQTKIRPGDIYEDCAYHPVLCTENYRGDLFGISLIDGTAPRGCSMFHCGPVKLSIEQALQMKKNWKPVPVDWSGPDEIGS